MNFIVPNRKSPKDTLAIARRWLTEFEHVVLATVVSTWGSSPVPVGGRLVVAPNGQFEGSVGGCVEVEVITEAADVLTHDQPKFLECGVAEEVAWRAGLPCGGTISIYLEPLQRQRDASHLDRILAARGARLSLAVLITLATGERRLFEAPGPMPAEIASCLQRERAGCSISAMARLFCMRSPLRSASSSSAPGTSDKSLADLATRIGYDVVFVDPRTAFTSQERIGETMALTNWPEISLRSLRARYRGRCRHFDPRRRADDERSRRCFALGLPVYRRPGL